MWGCVNGRSRPTGEKWPTRILEARIRPRPAAAAAARDRVVFRRAPTGDASSAARDGDATPVPPPPAVTGDETQAKE